MEIDQCRFRYFHQLPIWIQQGLVFWVMTIEVGIVFLVFGPKLFRRTAALYIVLLQIFYITIGNFGTWNYNVIAIASLLLDDDLFPGPVALLRRIRNERIKKVLRRATKAINKQQPEPQQQQPPQKQQQKAALPPVSSLNLSKQATKQNEPEKPKFQRVNNKSLLWHRHLAVVVAVLVILLTSVPLTSILRGTVTVPTPLSEVYVRLSPYRMVNYYGSLSRVLRDRYEVVIQASTDAHDWYNYQFTQRATPDEAYLAPLFTSPHTSRVSRSSLRLLLSSPRILSCSSD